MVLNIVNLAHDRNMEIMDLLTQYSCIAKFLTNKTTIVTSPAIITNTSPLIILTIQCKTIMCWPNAICTPQLQVSIDTAGCYFSYNSTTITPYINCYKCNYHCILLQHLHCVDSYVIQESFQNMKRDYFHLKYIQDCPSKLVHSPDQKQHNSRRRHLKEYEHNVNMSL